MLAEIITVGDEILIGQIVDTNSAWLSSTLNAIGINVFQITSISDKKEHIEKAVNEALSRVDIVLMTGGLGPTKDDITKKTLAEMFGMTMVRNTQVYSQIEQLMLSRGVEFNDSNKAQADLPSGCKVIENRNGTAAGMWFEKQSKVLVSMPGVPFEMKSMVGRQLLPMLEQHFELRSVVHKTIVTFGVAESVLSERLAEWEQALPDFLHLAYLPNPSAMRLRLSAYDVDREVAEKEIAAQVEALKPLLGESYVGMGDATLSSAVASELALQGQSLAVAESCTGGYLASRFTSMSGASAYFKGGVVAYSNDIKSSVLGVSAEDIERYGAVSEQVALQMADGVRKLCGASYALATTGIAGPEGGTAEKPVGTVWIALSSAEGTVARRVLFGALRQPNIERSASEAINMLRLELGRRN
ncbi:MAG: competence/damage-inducible protein A [Rikenellaceae bacterium]